MATSESSSGPGAGSGRRLARTVQVIVVSSVMFTFISYWRTAAVVLCDLASTAYYIGGIVERAIGPAAPWFILGVMLFSYAVRAVYIESCSLFVRGGVYRVVRAALGSFAAKLAVSALIFDYILTGPISTVSAGQYVVGLALDSLRLIDPTWVVADELSRDQIRRWGSVILACGVTLYFYRQNLLGIHESSDKALKIMIATTIMGLVVLGWCGVTLIAQGPANDVPRMAPELDKIVDIKDGREVPRINPLTGHQEDPLGFMDRVLPASWIEGIRHPTSWLSLLGLAGLFIAFGHSILAMSGEETLAQVYREVESPKLKNFQKAAFIVFVYSLLLTGTISFLALLIIPDSVRMTQYADNLIGGLAMSMIGPEWARLLLNTFVTVVGFLILAGACNTSIIGANGVLNRVAEDGILPAWALKPHPRYGTTSRILSLIVMLQLFTIVASRGDVYLLGEAYAFGVVWSFVFQAFSMVVLRFKDPRPRAFKVPLNLRIGSVELPIGLGLILFILLVAAVMNFLTKEVATLGGLLFGGLFFVAFTITERYYERRRQGAQHEHLEQFNQQTTDEITPAGLGLRRPYRKLVAIRSPHNLFMLEKALAETDPETTDMVVMTAKVTPPEGSIGDPDLDTYDLQLMTAVVDRAERAGKQVKPLIVPTNNPLYAVLNTAKDLQAQELVLGASNKYSADEQLEQISFYWISLHHGQQPPLTVRVLSRGRDVYLDLAGGNRIPKITDRKARSVAELRAAGVGVDRVLLVHGGTPASRDLFQNVLTMLDPEVQLAVIPMVARGTTEGLGLIEQDRERSHQLGRELEVILLGAGEPGPEVVRLARGGEFDLIILALPGDQPAVGPTLWDEVTDHVVYHAHCPVFLASRPPIPNEVAE